MFLNIIVRWDGNPTRLERERECCASRADTNDTSGVLDTMAFMQLQTHPVVFKGPTYSREAIFYRHAVCTPQSHYFNRQRSYVSGFQSKPANYLASLTIPSNAFVFFSMQLQRAAKMESVFCYQNLRRVNIKCSA